VLLEQLCGQSADCDLRAASCNADCGEFAIPPSDVRVSRSGSAD
jgi:hypothetical protein